MCADLMRPRLLRPGDRVRVVAASGPFDERRFEAGIEALTVAGFEPVYDQGIRAVDGYLAGDDRRRGSELRAALADADAAAIWLARGGYGAGRLLPQLAVDTIRRARKWFVGFSDGTALHAAWQRAGLASLHAANVTTLGTWTAEAREELFGWLMQPEAAAEMPIEPWRLRAARGAGPVVRGGAVRGWLAGGNLTVFASLVGTGSLPSLAGAVVFFEDVDERPYRLDRQLTQLRQAGVLDGVVAVVFGHLTDCFDPARKDRPEDVRPAVLRGLDGVNVPVVGGAPVGHERSSRALPFGVDAVVDCDAGVLRIGAAAK